MNTGFGKVIVVGEHAVVYGKPAIVCALEFGARATAQLARSTALHIEPWGMHCYLGDTEPSAPGAPSESDRTTHQVKQALQAVFRSYARDVPAMRIDVDIDLPAGRGLGASAALGVALVRAINEVLAEREDDQVVARRALHWEKVFHGRPSGIDAAAASQGGVLLFSSKEGGRALAAGTSLDFVIADSGTIAPTRTMVERVSMQHQSEPHRIEQTMDEIAGLVDRARHAIVTGDLQSLGQCMMHNHELLCSLQLSTPHIETLRSDALSAKALGVKLTGAGGGGCVLALAQDDDHAQALLKSMKPHSEFCFSMRIESRHTQS